MCKNKQIRNEQCTNDQLQSKSPLLKQYYPFEENAFTWYKLQWYTCVENLKIVHLSIL